MATAQINGILFPQHRLEGAILMAPSICFWRPRLPKDLVEEAFEKQEPWMQWNFLIGHYAPWLLYWWNTQNTRALFPPNKANTTSKSFSGLPNNSDMQVNMEEYSTQQGVYESVLRDFMVGFGEWEFEPLELENPFPGRDGAVQLWQGGADETVPVVLQRYIVDRLPWIQYHEVPYVGHKFALEDNIKYQIVMSLVTNITVATSSFSS